MTVYNSHCQFLGLKSQPKPALGPPPTKGCPTIIWLVGWLVGLALPESYETNESTHVHG